MSTRHTANPTLVTPTPPSGLLIPAVELWADAAWTEVFSTTPNELYLAGISVDSPLASFALIELEFGVGAVGDEEVIHVVKLASQYGVNTAHNWYWFEVPLGNIPSGVRLCVRVRGWNPSNNTARMNIMYYEALVSNHKSAAPSKCFPYRNSADDDEVLGGFETTWGTTPWQNSDWIEITPGEDAEITITSIVFTPTTLHRCPAEIDISRGAAGTEHSNILTTKRFFHSTGNSLFPKIVLPGGLPIPANTRLVYRVRRSVANGGATNSQFGFNYIYETSFLS